jgi:superfamily I DNA/RNA helicase
VVVPAALTVRKPKQSNLAAGLTEYLLDYDQEAVLKNDLDLPVEVVEITSDFRLNILNGVAGSGKTLVLLYRLRLLQALFPNKNYLVLTLNRPLIRDLQARFYHLHGSLPENIEWSTFAGWCHRHWPASPGWIEPLGQQRRADLVRLAHQYELEASSISTGMLSSEIDWIKDRLIESEEVYLTAERRGRGFRLNQEQRSQVYRAYQFYQSRLERNSQLDWGDVPRRMWQFFEDGRVLPPQYDVVLMDEAQFFAPLWFEIVRRLVRPTSGHLFLAADPTQGFLRRGSSWKALAGLDVRGHTHNLRRSYRTTREILDFATLFYRQRVQDDADEEVLVPNLAAMPNGVLPILIPLPSPQDEIARVANEITALVSQGQPMKDILVLHANWQGVNVMLLALEGRLGKGKAFDPKDQFPGNYVRVTTINAGTGLESPIVFLVGLRELFEAEQSIRISDDEREGLILENTRKIYMAITRAGQRLVLTYVGNLPAELKGLYKSVAFS